MSRTNYILIFLVISLLMLVHAALYFSVELDDPYITFRYAKHVASGLGPVWNPGEAPVEGYTSTLWMLCIAGAIHFGFQPYVFAKLLSLITVLAALAIIWFNQNLLSNWHHRFLACLMIVFCPDIAYYSMSGMEHPVTVLFGVLLMLLIYSSDEIRGRSVYFLACVLGAYTWLRPEGLLFDLFFSLYIALSTTPRAIKYRFFLFLSALILPFYISRYCYFGDFLPNTYYAKHTGGGRFDAVLGGISYFAEANGYYYFLIGLFVWNIPLILARKNLADLTVLATIAGLFGYILILGGDDISAFPGLRLLMPALPLLIVLGFRTIETRQRLGRLGGTAIIAILAVIAFGPALKQIKASTHLNEVSAGSLSPGRILGMFVLSNSRFSDRSPLSEYFLTQTPPGEFIAIPWAGKVSYETDLPVIDMLGLNDRHISRLQKVQRGIAVKYDAGYILSRKPYFICENARMADLTVEQISRLSDDQLYARGAWMVGERNLLKDPRLESQYSVDKDAPVSGTCFRRGRNT